MVQPKQSNQMKTLTLTDICCYGKGLMFKIDTSKGYKFPENFIDELTTIGIIDNCLSFKKAPDFYLGDAENDHDAKPILRPLSSLTTPITHKGETFVPIDFFQIGDDDNNFFEFDNGNLKVISLLTAVAKYNTWHDLNYLPYAVVHKLIEWRFDVFGLISDGLAVSVDTLDNDPYAV